MRRAAARPIVVLVVAMIAIIGGSAWAKGPVTAVIEGPGIDGPILVSGVFDGTNDAPIARLADAMGLDELLFGVDGQALPQEMEQPATGPVYQVTWTWFNGAVIPVELYPAAEGGPLVHLTAGLYRSENGNVGFGVRGGWYRADDDLVQMLDELGVPLEHRGPAPVSIVALLAVLGVLGGTAVVTRSLLRRRAGGQDEHTDERIAAGPVPR